MLQTSGCYNLWFRTLLYTYPQKVNGLKTVIRLNFLTTDHYHNYASPAGHKNQQIYAHGNV